MAVGDVELGQHVANVRLYGALADDQAFRDTGVGQALGHQLEHLALTV